ncbi:MAG: CotH kinase family protein [Bacteroidaceae bacterium]|nr:CotH kinase family protein [Bacteroidaceae bacterium]
MKFSSALFSLFLLLQSAAMPCKAQLLINEVMQSNIDCLWDGTNQFPDSWVELYNPSDKIVSMSEYSLGESNDARKAWQLPKDMNIAAKGYAIIYCDNEGTGRHTNFRLNTGKDFQLHLFHKGVPVDTLGDLKKMPAPNIAYGRVKDGAAEWGYEMHPTPGKTNYGGVTDLMLGEPIFSQQGGVYETDSPFYLHIRIPDDAPEGTMLRYTVNGSEPDDNSIEVDHNTSILINGNKVVRAKLYCKGYLSPRSTTHSYIFLNREMTLPVISIVSDESYFYDDKKGIYVTGKYNSDSPNYKYDWRRPINFEMFDKPDAPSVLNQLCETRVSGAASRSLPLKSLALYAHKRFGEKKFDYEFFPEQREGQTNFKSLVLRNAGNDFNYLYMRDAVVQRVMAEHTDIDFQAYRPAIIFINGIYKGILNIRERANDNNIYTNYDGLEDVDVVETWYFVKTGTDENIKAFRKFYNQKGHSWDEYSQWMDCDEFINIMIMNCYFGNIDFPANNCMLWRPRKEGGRWRWIAKDLDYTIGIFESSATSTEFDYIKWLYNYGYNSEAHWGNTPNETLLFRNLMEDETFARRFIDRYTIYMGTFLNFEGIWKTWGPMYEMIRKEYPIHRKLVNEWWPKYPEELDKAQKWVKERNAHALKQLREQYELGSIINLKVNQEVDNECLQGITLCMNEVDLESGVYDGGWFAGHELTLSASSEKGAENEVTGWNIQYKSNNAVTQQTLEGATLTLKVPYYTEVSINAIVAESTGIEHTIANNASEDGTWYDLYGRKLSKVKPGQIVINCKRKVIVR